MCYTQTLESYVDDIALCLIYAKCVKRPTIWIHLYVPFIHAHLCDADFDVAACVCMWMFRALRVTTTCLFITFANEPNKSSIIWTSMYIYLVYISIIWNAAWFVDYECNKRDNQCCLFVSTEFFIHDYQPMFNADELDDFNSISITIRFFQLFSREAIWDQIFEFLI